MKPILIKLWNHLKLPYGLQIFAMRRVNDQFLVGVTGVIFDKKGNILLVKHSYNRKGNLWSLPGGYLKGQEHPKEGLEREVKEETGLTISADQRIKIRTDRASARLDIVYLGTLISGTFSKSQEVIKANFFQFDQLPPLPKDQLFVIERARKEKERVINPLLSATPEEETEKTNKSKIAKIKSYFGFLKTSQ